LWLPVSRRTAGKSETPRPARLSRPACCWAKRQAPGRRKPSRWRPWQRPRLSQPPPCPIPHRLASCTREVHRLYQGCTRVLSLSIPCAPLAHPLYTPCTQRQGGSGQARDAGNGGDARGMSLLGFLDQNMPSGRAGDGSDHQQTEVAPAQPWEDRSSQGRHFRCRIGPRRSGLDRRERSVESHDVGIAIGRRLPSLGAPKTTVQRSRGSNSRIPGISSFAHVPAATATTAATLQSQRQTHRSAPLPRLLDLSTFDRTLFSAFECYTTRRCFWVAA